MEEEEEEGCRGGGAEEGAHLQPGYTLEGASLQAGGEGGQPAPVHRRLHSKLGFFFGIFGQFSEPEGRRGGGRAASPGRSAPGAGGGGGELG